jgi:predicted DNA-binding protein with PD1-like motif
MKWQATRFGFVLRLQAGEEIFGSIQRFAERHGIRSAILTGLGAVGETELGFFHPATREYSKRRFTGDYEIGSLIGNLSELEGRPHPHCHLVISGPDFVAHAGHLFRAVVSVTCEIAIATDPDPLLRIPRPDLGFHRLEPSESDETATS